MTFITISEELNLPSHFSKLYMHRTYIYRSSYFNLIVGSSSVNRRYFRRKDSRFYKRKCIAASFSFLATFLEYPLDISLGEFPGSSDMRDKA